MDGVHDMGGMEGFGPVAVEADEPVFHAPWEGRTLGLLFCTSGALPDRQGEFRHSIERMDGVHYLTSSYYEHWLTGLATRLVERGVLDPAELAERAGGPFPLSYPKIEEAVAPGPGRSFEVGDSVTVGTRVPRHHTRCPRYVRGKTGTVVRVDPPFALHDDPDRTERVYCVRFEAVELWGADGDPVHVDLWESYLQ